MLVPLPGRLPEVHRDAWVAPTATVVGAVSLEAQASAWYGAVLRGDFDTIAIGARSNVQDGCAVHADPGFPVVGAGALLPAGTVVPPGSLVVGAPGKVRRETTAEERELIGLNAAMYLDGLAAHRAATAG